MKKSHIAVILFSIMVAALAGFTGCNTGNSGDESESDSSIYAPESTFGNSRSLDNSESRPESFESEPGQKLSDEESLRS